MFTELDFLSMRRALELANRGRGSVEPNPLVGCVIVRESQIVGEGWHGRYGGPHAEVEALRAAGANAQGAALYVTLEPCCHFGKTPPCTRAVIAAGIKRVIVAQRDPFPAVDGGGIRELEAAGIEVLVGLCNDEARRQTAPYRKLLSMGRPWVIAKWAMSLDGRIATRTGDSRWISNEQSRLTVHELRGQVDAVIVGRGTLAMDDPLLSARPPGPRLAARVVLDREARSPLNRQLFTSPDQGPVIVVTGPHASSERKIALRQIGCEVLELDQHDSSTWLAALLDDFGRRRWTNVLIEGGGRVLGAFFDAQLVDEARVYVAPKVIGGADAPGPVAGVGRERMADALTWPHVRIDTLAGDVRIVAQRE
jgi:diaminohydroxyphosphoribosylaminopyrimidine deaminase/5-amino-6-(5-phosphoribosylamino)uracil reductase